MCVCVCICKNSCHEATLKPIATVESGCDFRLYISPKGKLHRNVGFGSSVAGQGRRKSRRSRMAVLERQVVWNMSVEVHEMQTVMYEDLMMHDTDQ